MVEGLESEVKNLCKQMRWCNWNPFLHARRNSVYRTTRYYYRLYSILENIEIKDKEITYKLNQELKSARYSFDKIYGITLYLKDNYIKIRESPDHQVFNGEKETKPNDSGELNEVEIDTDKEFINTLQEVCANPEKKLILNQVMEKLKGKQINHNITLDISYEVKGSN